MATILCPKCGAENEAGQLICVKCETLLFNPTTTTVHMRINPALLRLRHARQAESPVSSLPEHTILLQIRGMSERLTFEEGTEIILGRTDLAASPMQRLDLSPYGAHDRGVSRDHALLRYTNHTLTLTDLNSANGTSVNLNKLTPNQPKVLNNGDEFMLGTLSIVVHFEPRPEPKEAEAPRFDETLPLAPSMPFDLNGKIEQPSPKPDSKPVSKVEPISSNNHSTPLSTDIRKLRNTNKK